MEEKKKFSSFQELGTFIKKKRRETGDRIEILESRLFIKKSILQNIENGIFTKIDYEKNSYLKGFLKTYLRDLKIIDDCELENLFLKNTLDIKKTNVSLDVNKTEKSKFGSLVILTSLILIGILFLLWNKNTYQSLFELEKFLN